MSFWKLKVVDKKLAKKLKGSVFLISFLGAANVGKIVSDFLIDKFRAELVYKFVPKEIPPFAMINEKGVLVEPSVAAFHFKSSGGDFLILTTNFPLDVSYHVYDLSKLILKLFVDLKGSEIVGISTFGLPSQPKNPSVYCMSYSKSVVDRFMDFKGGSCLKAKIKSVFGPVLGVPALLVVLSKPKRLNSVILLVESYDNLFFLGFDSALSILQVLKKKYNLKIDFHTFNSHPKNKIMSRRSVGKSKSVVDKSDRISYIG